MFALKRRAIGVSVALVAAASLTATLLISTALAQDPPPSITSIDGEQNHHDHRHGHRKPRR